jgi:hypothetical protein
VTVNITQIPAPRVPFIDERTGLISREWFRFLNNQYQLTGGGTTQTSIADLELSPSLAANVEDEMAVVKGQIDDLQKGTARYEPNPVNYGAFYSTTTQTAAAANTPYAMTFNNTSNNYGVYIDPAASSHIKVTRPTVYNMQFSLQLDKTSGGTGLFWVWIRVNGVDVPNTASQVRIQGNNAEIFVAANIFVPMSNGDYLQLMWAADTTSVQILAEAATAVHPGIPSVILTMTQVYI